MVARCFCEMNEEKITHVKCGDVDDFVGMINKSINTPYSKLNHSCVNLNQILATVKPVLQVLDKL